MNTPAFGRLLQGFVYYERFHGHRHAVHTHLCRTHIPLEYRGTGSLRLVQKLFVIVVTCWEKDHTGYES